MDYTLLVIWLAFLIAPNVLGERLAHLMRAYRKTTRKLNNEYGSVE